MLHEAEVHDQCALIRPPISGSRVLELPFPILNWKDSVRNLSCTVLLPDLRKCTWKTFLIMKCTVLPCSSSGEWKKN